MATLTLPAITIAPPSGGATFGAIPIGGGGYVTGINMANDGTMFVRVDVGGLYRSSTTNYNAASQGWVNLISSYSLPPSVWGFSNGNAGGAYIAQDGGALGPYEAAVVPGNSQIVYMMWHGQMFVSMNSGSAWTKMANFPSISYSWGSDNNGGQRTWQKRMAVDPNNPDRVYIGTPLNGLYVTSNGTSGASATFTQISTGTISNSVRNGICAIAIDPSSGTTGGFTNHIVLSNGVGMYESTNGGSTWAAAAAGGPTQAMDGVFSGGTYYCGTSAGVSMYKAGAWTSTAVSGGLHGISINPFDPTWIAGWRAGGGAYDQGVINALGGTSITWYGPYYTDPINPNVPPSDVGWLANTNAPSSPAMSEGGCAWDPVNSGLIWMTSGYQVSYVQPSSKTMSSGTSISFVSRDHSLEAMVTQGIVSIPGYSSPVGSVDDQQFFKIDSLTTPPSASTPQLGARYHNSAGWMIDASLTNPGVIGVLSTGYYVSSSGNYSGYSLDGGATWTQFPTKPTSTDIGSIIAFDANHFVVQSSGSPAKYTTNAGTTWTASNAPSVSFLAYSNPQNMAQDSAGNGYLYTGSSVYKTTDMGQTWSLASSPSMGGIGWYGAKLAAVPANAGYLFYSYGYRAGTTYPTGQGFYKSTDGGSTWAATPNVNDVWTYGFGAVASGWTYPTLWLFGFVNKGGAGLKWGLWRSRDLGASDWTWYADWPNGNLDPPRCMTGDMNDATKIYWGGQSSSFMYGSGLT
jgi:hypothetical protein